MVRRNNTLFSLLWIATTAAQLTPNNNNNNSFLTEGACINNDNCDNTVEDNSLNVIDPKPPAEPAKTTTTFVTEECDMLCRVKKNSIWNAVKEQQGDKLFGKVLDAGTGLNSMNFISTLVDYGMTSYTAVTGSMTMYNDVQAEVEKLGIEQLGDVLFGNWFDDTNPIELEEMYDVILVDYLIGAMDAFSPYMQDAMMTKLVSYLNPGGRMYVIGQEPIPDYLEESDYGTTNSIRGAQMICQMRLLRDSAVLLGGRRIYREFPKTWMERQFEFLGNQNMTVLEGGTQEFPIYWTQAKFAKQLNNGRINLQYFISPELAKKMKKSLDDLEEKFSKVTQKVGKVKFGYDYLVSAEKLNDGSSTIVPGSSKPSKKKKATTSHKKRVPQPQGSHYTNNRATVPKKKKTVVDEEQCFTCTL